MGYRPGGVRVTLTTCQGHALGATFRGHLREPPTCRCGRVGRSGRKSWDSLNDPDTVVRRLVLDYIDRDIRVFGDFLNSAPT